MSEAWTEQLRHVPRLWVVADNDRPNEPGATTRGEEFARQIIDRLPQTTLVTLLPEVKDLSEFKVAGNGAEELAKLMQQGRLRRVKTIMTGNPTWISALTRPRDTGPARRTPTGSSTPPA